MSKIRIVINGAAGRMGRRLVALGHADADLEIVGALEAPNHPKQGCDAGSLAGIGDIGVSVAERFAGAADAMIDFSSPSGTEAATALCVQQALPLVVATTGLSEKQQQAVKAAAASIPVVWSPNMSTAVNLTMKLASIAASALKDAPGGADVEIIERHHRYKKDSPSGTALHIGQLIAKEMGQTDHIHGRRGLVGERPHDQIAYHALRVGDNPGEHTIVFGLLGETIELTVRATNRDCYALGALAAAKFIVNQPAGFYGMYDVLGL